MGSKGESSATRGKAEGSKATQYGEGANAWTEERKEKQRQAARAYQQKVRDAKKEAVLKLEAEAEGGLPRQLAEMRHVYNQSRQLDSTHGQKECRRWLDDDRKGFMAAKAKLEEAWLKSQGVSAGKETAGVADVGEKAALELVERLLAGFKA